MEDIAYYKEEIDRLKLCVIIPTYNNAKTLSRVLDGVLQYTSNIFIVNDGSTDCTQQILLAYPSLAVIHLPENKGKGKALRTGFAAAVQKQYSYAITIDSDGQHFAADIPVFIRALQADGDALYIGSRNMTQDGIPKKSSFGNKFSNFWFQFETGIRLQDTQSGYRLYPLQLIPKRYFTTKFELEIEVIVRSAWKGIPVRNIPIDISYDPAERVSHFRPFKDFTRISILNTVLVIIALLYIKPRDFFLSYKRKGFKRFFLENVLRNTDSISKKSLSISLGVFIGLTPLWGFHTALVLLLAAALRLNKAIAFAFSNISSPPFIPFIIYGSLKISSLVTHKAVPSIRHITSASFADIKDDFLSYVIGSFILAAVMAAVSGFSGFLFMSAFSANKKK